MPRPLSPEGPAVLQGGSPISNLLLRACPPRVLVAAHRGAWSQAPENSIAAIEDAIRLGADIIELDVRSSADGALVLLHDRTLDRMSNASGTLREVRYRDLRDVRLRTRAGGPDAPLSVGSRVPTLAQALEACRDRIVVNLDTKDPDLAERIVEAVIACGMAHQVFVKADVADGNDIDRLRSHPALRRIALVPMMRARPGRFVSDLKALEALHCPLYEVAFDELADLEEGRAELRRQGARLWVNTIAASHSVDFNDACALLDPDAVWGRLLDVGVDAIQTDEIEQLSAYLQVRGRR